MKIDRLAFLGLLGAVGLLSASPCWAGESDPFGTFPESCASQARDQYYPVRDARANHKGPDGGGWIFYDGNSPSAQHLVNIDTAEFNMTSEAGTLLYEGMSNKFKPRISNQESKRAVRIGRAYDADDAAHFSPVDPGNWSFTKKTDQFKCLTDKCPQGASCSTIDLREQRSSFGASIPAVRSHITKIFKWAKSVKKFKARATRLEQAYDRNEATLKELVASMPSNLVVVDVIVPIR